MGIPDEKDPHRELSKAEQEAMDASGLGILPFYSWELGPEWDEILDKDDREDQQEEF